MTGGGELQLLADFQNADMRVREEYLRISDSFFQNVLVNAAFVLVLKTAGQVVFCVSQFLCERVQINFFCQVRINVVHAFSDEGVTDGPLSGLMYPVDKIGVHGSANLLNLRDGGGGFDGLNIVVAACIGIFRRVTAADGGAGDECRINNHFVLYLPERIAGTHDAALHEGVGNGSMVYISFFHGFQHKTFILVGVVAQKVVRLFRGGYLRCRKLVGDLRYRDDVSRQGMVKLACVVIEKKRRNDWYLIYKVYHQTLRFYGHVQGVHFFLDKIL